MKRIYVSAYNVYKSISEGDNLWMDMKLNLAAFSLPQKRDAINLQESCNAMQYIFFASNEVRT